MKGVPISLEGTVEPRFNEPHYNAVLGITNDILQPGQSYSKMYGAKPRLNELDTTQFFYNEHNRQGAKTADRLTDMT